MNWKDIQIVDENSIRGFFGEYRWLSNFHLVPIGFQGIVYPSTESAYMASKTNVETQRVIFRTVTPAVAKLEGQKVILRADWEDVKLDFMYEFNRQKFYNNPDLRRALLETGEKYLEELNSWGDVYWGVCKNVGENHLGKILMRIRKELQDESGV